MSGILRKYVPEGSVPLISDWFKMYDFHLKISRSRTSKLGDFRPAFKGKPNRISVNGDLNPYHFLITLTHEVAHVVTWEKHQNKVNPHGTEWKIIYTCLLRDILGTIEIPKALENAIAKHLNNPKASSCSDPELYKALKIYDLKTKVLYLEDIGEGQLFKIHGKRLFKKGNKRRTRFECIEMNSKRMYLVSGHAEVELLEK